MLGLITASAVIVHLSGGVVEAHLHFFVMAGVTTLYQDWLPFGLALAYVVVHHTVLGVLAPAQVFNHPAAQREPGDRDQPARPCTWPRPRAATALSPPDHARPCAQQRVRS